MNILHWTFQNAWFKGDSEISWKNCYMAALVVKDAYYSIPVEKSF